MNWIIPVGAPRDLPPEARPGIVVARPRRRRGTLVAVGDSRNPPGRDPPGRTVVRESPRQLRPRGPLRRRGGGRFADHPLGRGGRARSGAGPAGAPTRSSTGASRRSPAVSCRTSRASTPSSRRPTSRTCAAAASTTSPCSVRRSTAARRIAPAPASGRRASARSRRSTVPTVSSWASTCANRSRSPTSATSSRSRRNIEKTFDQITKAVAHVYASGAFPVVLGGDHSIGYPDDPRRRSTLNGGSLGHHPLRPPRRHPGDRPRRADAHDAVVPRHRHPERPAKNLVQIGIGGWQAPAARRQGRPGARHDDHDRHRLRRDGHRSGRGARARRRLGRRRRRLAAASTSTAWTLRSCPAPAGRSPAASCRARC